MYYSLYICVNILQKLAEYYSVNLLVLRGLTSKLVHFHVCSSNGMSMPFVQTVKIDLLPPEKGVLAYINRQLILLYRSHWVRFASDWSEIVFEYSAGEQGPPSRSISFAYNLIARGI